MDKKRVAVICNFSVEPRALGTFEVMLRAYSVCAGWFKRNLIEQLQNENYHVDLYMFANYGDEISQDGWKAERAKEHLLDLHDVKEFHLDSFLDVRHQMWEDSDHGFEIDKHGVLQINLWQTYTLLTSIERIQEEYDYYIKARVDSFISPVLSFDKVLGNIKNRSQGHTVFYHKNKVELNRFNKDIGIQEDTNFIVSPSVRHVPSLIRPYLLADTLLAFDKEAAQRMVRNKKRWMRKIVRDFIDTQWYLQEEVSYHWPETALGSLPAMSNVAIHGDRDFDCALYRYVMYEAQEELEELFADITNYESHKILSDWTMKDYVLWTDPKTGNTRSSKFVETLGGTKRHGLKYVK